MYPGIWGPLVGRFGKSQCRVRPLRMIGSQASSDMYQRDRRASRHPFGLAWSVVRLMEIGAWVQKNCTPCLPIPPHLPVLMIYRARLENIPGSNVYNQRSRPPPFEGRGCPGNQLSGFLLVLGELALWSWARIFSTERFLEIGSFAPSHLHISHAFLKVWMKPCNTKRHCRARRIIC